MSGAAVVTLGWSGLSGPVTAATATPTLSPSATSDAEPDPSSVSPGVLGFVVIFALAVVVWLLLRNMTGHLRRMRFREEQARARPEEPGPDEGRGPAGGPPDAGPTP